MHLQNSISMNYNFKITLLVLCFLIIQNITAQTNTKFPLKISANGRYLTDSNDKPFLYVAETPWCLISNLTKEEVDEFLDIRIKQGFNTIQIHLLPFVPINRPNKYGEWPFTDFDISKPNERYFNYAKWVISKAEEKGLLVALNPIWLDCCGSGWEDILKKNGIEKSRIYGQYLGKKFAEHKNLIWIQGGDKDPREFIDHYRQIALGIKESIPSAIQTYHASSGHSSTEVIPYFSNSWLNFSFTYTYFGGKKVWMTILGFGRMPEVYEVNYLEYQRHPFRPFILGESQYEGEDTSSYFPFKTTDIVRRQSWWSMLSGSCGFAYGSRYWSVPANWRNMKNDHGALQMGILRKFFESFNWQDLTPDINGQIITSGKGKFGDMDYITAAYLTDYSKIIIYIPPTGNSPRNFALDAKIKPMNYTSYWFSPVNGTKQTATFGSRYSEIQTPGNNGSGQNDWILVLDRNN
jgi:hypothetical protein